MAPVNKSKKDYSQKSCEQQKQSVRQHLVGVMQDTGFNDATDAQLEQLGKLYNPKIAKLLTLSVGFMRSVPWLFDAKRGTVDFGPDELGQSDNRVTCLSENQAAVEYVGTGLGKMAMETRGDAFQKTMLIVGIARSVSSDPTLTPEQRQEATLAAQELLAELSAQNQSVQKTKKQKKNLVATGAAQTAQAEAEAQAAKKQISVLRGGDLTAELPITKGAKGGRRKPGR